MNRPRTIAAWTAAISALVAIQFSAAVVGAKIGVPVFVDVDPYTVHYGRGVEVERDFFTTTYGWGILLLSILAAVAAWYSVIGKATTSIGRANFFGFLLGSFILIVGGIPLWKIFADAEGAAAVLGNMLDLALVAAAIFGGVRVSNHFKKSSQP